MFILNVSSLLLSSLVLQIAAHGHHDQVNEDRKPLARRGLRNFPREYTMNCPLRTDAERTLITQEFSNAAAMATYAQENLLSPQAATYTSTFIPSDLFSIPQVQSQLQQAYGHPAVMNDQTDGSYTFTVTCDGSTTFCGNGYWAHMSDDHSTMNICPAWFSNAGTAADRPGKQDLASTTDILAGCTASPPTIDTLWHIWFGKAQALLHEWTHTTFFTGTTQKTLDYAYGPTQCQALAAGTRTMPPAREWISQKEEMPLCPSEDDPKVPGICDPNFSIENADTFAIIAGALYFGDSSRCNKIFQLGNQPGTAQTRSAKFKRQDDVDEIALDPPYDGFGFDASACTTPDANGCCGECSSLPDSSGPPASAASSITTAAATSNAITATQAPDCGSNLGQAPCSSSPPLSSMDPGTTVTVTPTPTTAPSSSSTDSLVKQTATGCADPNDVEECDRDMNNDRPSCTTADDCNAPCRSQLASNQAALQYGFASTCIDKAFCTCSVEAAEVVGQILIELGDVVCAVWNNAIPAAAEILQFVIPYVGELAEGAEAAEFFEAAGQVLKKGSKDCSIACKENAPSGQKFTAVNPMDQGSWAGILPCDNDSVPPASAS